MEFKKLAMTGVIIGSFVGSLVPLLWGASFLSFASVLFTAFGGIAGIYLAYRITH